MNVGDKVIVSNKLSYFDGYKGTIVEIEKELIRVRFADYEYGYWFKPESLVLEPKEPQSVNDLAIELLKKQDYSMKELADLLSIDERQVREVIDELVIKGYPIHNINGYGWIHTQEQLEKCYQLQRKRALSSLARLRAYKKMRIDTPLLEEEK